ncbi:MAG: hypothetical protein M3Y72_27215 [Acidobacteriota bacterium]|nr:hypothetical protein [Acidobacteriota bacterium]
MAANSFERPLLTPDFCQEVVVRNAPWPKRFNNDPEQDLSELGIVEKDQAAQHKARIQADLHQNQFSIAQGNIRTGPGVSVGDSSDSVLTHAH